MKVDRDHALKIAAEDARRHYRDLDAYSVNIAMVNGDWKVDYELKNRESQGGGPHYVISAETGEILSRRYEQ